MFLKSKSIDMFSTVCLPRFKLVVKIAMVLPAKKRSAPKAKKDGTEAPVKPVSKPAAPTSGRRKKGTAAGDETEANVVPLTKVSRSKSTPAPAPVPSSGFEDEDDLFDFKGLLGMEGDFLSSDNLENLLPNLDEDLAKLEANLEELGDFGFDLIDEEDDDSVMGLGGMGMGKDVSRLSEKDLDDTLRSIESGKFDIDDFLLPDVEDVGRTAAKSSKGGSINKESPKMRQSLRGVPEDEDEEDPLEEEDILDDDDDLTLSLRDEEDQDDLMLDVRFNETS
jgi:hypothetical protein